jgi:hypothetical protein
MADLLSRASDASVRVAPYALVPFALSLLAFQKVRAATDPSSVSVNVKFPLPADVATLWTLVDAPTQGVAVTTPVPFLFVPVFLAVEAAVVAGFLGGVGDAVRGETPDFAAAAADHWLSILGVRVVQFVLFVGLGLALVGAGPLGLLLAFPVILLLGYMLWAAPYLVVLRDLDALTALAASWSLASDGGRYLSFSLAYLLVGAVASALLSPLVSSAGILGVLVGAAIVAYPAVVASAAAAIVVDETAAPAEPVASRGA